MSTDLNPDPSAAASTCCGHCSSPAAKTEHTSAGRCSTTWPGPIATPADREAAIAALAEEYAMRRIVGEMHEREEHPEQRLNEDHADLPEDEEDDLWQMVEYAADRLDTVTLNPKDRMRFDDHGHVLDDGRFQPLMGLVLDSLRRLRDLFEDETDPNQDWAAYATRNLLARLVTAIEVAEQENWAKRRRLGAHLAEEFGLTLAVEPPSAKVESNSGPANSAPPAMPSPPDKPLRDLYQIDAWSNYPPDDGSFIDPDADGHALVGGAQRDPRNTDSTVRVQVLKGTDKAQVLALLCKVIAWIERDWDSLVADMEREAWQRDRDDGQEPGGDNLFGVCPICRRYDGSLNIGSEHWFYCSKHKVKWLVGSNLFASWRHEDEDEWQRNAAKLRDFDEVEPGLLPETEQRFAKEKAGAGATPPREELDDESIPF